MRYETMKEKMKTRGDKRYETMKEKMFYKTTGWGDI